MPGTGNDRDPWGQVWHVAFVRVPRPGGFVVVGGLAIGANGFPRATRDVDFLVGAEAFEHHADGLVTLRAGVPFQVTGDTWVRSGV